MKSATELSAQLTSEVEEYLAALDREYDANRAAAVKMLETLRGGGEGGSASKAPAVVSGAAQGALSRRVTPMKAVEIVVPGMEDGFSFRDLLETIQLQFPDCHFKKEPVRGAFRVYEGRENSPVVRMEKADLSEPYRYKRRVDTQPPLRGFRVKDLSVNGNGQKAEEGARA